MRHNFNYLRLIHPRHYMWPWDPVRVQYYEPLQKDVNQVNALQDNKYLSKYLKVNNSTNNAILKWDTRPHIEDTRLVRLIPFTLRQFNQTQVESQSSLYLEVSQRRATGDLTILPFDRENTPLPTKYNDFNHKISQMEWNQRDYYDKDNGSLYLLLVTLKSLKINANSLLFSSISYFDNMYLCQVG